MEAMVRSALDSAKAAEHFGLGTTRLSCRQGERGARPDRRVHESGGTVRLSAAPGLTEAAWEPRADCLDGRLAPLLLAGIGDTIR